MPPFVNGVFRLIVRWLDLALRDFEEAMQDIAQTNPEAARDVAQKIWEGTQRLARHPDQGRIGRVSATRELVISGTSYIVPYRIAGDCVQILRTVYVYVL